jgi:ubiquitin fusion degradation protein 1
MMQNLLLEEGSVITVTNVSLPKATFVKLQPQHTDFLEISNPRAVLEHALRNYSCVTKGDVIQIPYNSKNYHFELKDVQPQDAACIIETDCQVDFDAPVGYQEEVLPRRNVDSRSASSSTCPSPTLSSTSSVLHGKLDSDPMSTTDTEDGPKIRIVDGKIVRPEDDNSSSSKGPSTSFLAPKTGATGVQRNAAIPDRAPTVDYWAIQAGDGARLDGKTPATLKDLQGNVVDIRKIRAEAAAQRMKQQEQGSGFANISSTTNGDTSATAAAAAVVSKRKPIVGSKYSRLKQSAAAFHGSAGTMK